MNQEAFFSKYIIDGVTRELTPAAVLASVLEKPLEPRPAGPPIHDESLDPSPGVIPTDSARIHDYLGAVLKENIYTPVPFAAPCTRARIAGAIIDSAWRTGAFRLDDLALTAKWSFEEGRVGDMAALYSSVEAAADYIDNLRLEIRRLALADAPFDVRFSTPFSGAPRLVDEMLHPDPQSWVAYVPFDTSDYRLGGSQLAAALGFSAGVCPQVNDPDYLMDCFEVVREFAEDGVLLSADTVGSGGLLAALGRMCGDGVGVYADVSGIMSSAGEDDPVRIFFSEVPGAVIQIRDSDFDYVDAEFLLQDIVWFPLGHPSPDGLVHTESSARGGIQTILQSLMQYAEGED